MDKILIKRGTKEKLEKSSPLSQGELFLARDEERLYVGGPKGNIPISTQKDVDEINEQLTKTLDNVNSLRINVKHLPPPFVSAVGDGKTDDTQAFQNAFYLASQLYGGNTSKDYGYMGWYMPVIQVPHGIYKVGTVTTPQRFRLEGDGMAVIVSKDGTPSKPAGTFIDNVVTNMTVKKLGFLFFDTVFRTPTNNTDFSFITFEECNVAKVNTLIDMVSYKSSASTTFKMERCNVSYGVKTLVKLYCDKAHFANNWFNHSMDSYFMELDTYATFESNVWVPTSPGPNKAYIYFNGSTIYSALHFKDERFGGEDGSCPIVVVENANKGETSKEVYRHQGISFENCFLASHSTYNPDGLDKGVRACVILRPSLSKHNTINYISFRNTAFLPDLSDGIVQSYNVPDIKSLLPDTFVIDFDYASAASGTKGVNKLASPELMEFVNADLVTKRYSGVSKSGKMVVTDTSTPGRKKATFKVDLGFKPVLSSFTFLLVTIGQSDSSYPFSGYSYQSVYLFTIHGEHHGQTRAKISYTKLHSTVGGASLGANADIVSAHFGSGETGDSVIPLDEYTGIKDVTIVFGTRVRIGNAYLIPLYDTTLTV